MRKAVLLIGLAIFLTFAAGVDAQAGTKTLSVKAENDYNVPEYTVQLDVSADGKDIGTLSYTKNDNSWTVESIQIPEDTNKVRLEFKYDWCGICRSSAYSGDGGDLNAYIDWLEVDGVRIEAENFIRTGYLDIVYDNGTWAAPYGVDHIFYDPYAGSKVILMAHDYDWVEYDIPGVFSVLIDIKPGSDINPVNISSKGVIPVAILTTQEFDAADVDPETVSFGPLGAWPEHYALEDVDLDGDTDMILHFRTRDTGIGAEDTGAVLKGNTYDGMNIEGSDSVRVLESRGGRK